MKIITKLFLLTVLVYNVGCTEEKKQPELRKYNQEELKQIIPLTKQSAPAPSQPAETGQAPTQSASSQTGVALNPPHGEPGHDCAIEVGAPLNSKPTTPTESIQNVLPATTPAATPVENSMPQQESAQPRLNPAHGLPGHDCAIPVGQPLK